MKVVKFLATKRENYNQQPIKLRKHKIRGKRSCKITTHSVKNRTEDRQIENPYASVVSHKIPIHDHAVQERKP